MGTGNRWTVAVLILLGLGLSASSAPSARAASVVDPTGDTFNTGTIDVTSTEVLLAIPTTTINITFAASVAAPSAFAPNSVVGFIDLDTGPGPGGTAPWGGPVTGGNNWINFFIPPNPGIPTVPGPTVSLGDEFYIDLGSETFHPGLVDVVTTSTDTNVGTAPITYSGSSLTILMSSALIGNPGALRYGVIVGDFNSPTDRAPNGATGILTVVPEPGSWLLAGLGFVGLALPYRLGRRRVGEGA
jgi:hypothetical protein